MRRRGFTLIELLVVIAIIAVLAAILFPVFTTVRDKGKQAACLNNMRQVGSALLLYAQSNNDWLPLHRSDTNGILWFLDKSTNPPPNALLGLLPYVKTTAVFQCPSLRPVPKQGRAIMISDTNLMGNAAALQRPSAKLVAPTRTIVFQEFGLRSYALYMRPARLGGGTYGWWAGWDNYANHHNGGANFLYCDGHSVFKYVKALRSGDFGLIPGDDFPDEVTMYKRYKCINPE